MIERLPSERLLGSPVVGRKNWLFAGSQGGARAAAIHFSIVLSCELAGIDPWPTYGTCWDCSPRRS